MSEEPSTQNGLPQANGALFDNGAVTCPFSKKVCKICRTAKPFEAFYTNRTDGRLFRKSECKECHKARERTPEGKKKKKERTDRYYKNNMDKVKASNKRYRQSVGRECLRKRDRRVSLKHNWGLTEAQYDAMAIAQNGRCAICGVDTTSPRVRNGALVIDHCHKTGKTRGIRGLLCNQCNSGLGYFNDNPELIDKAAGYLRFHKNRLAELSE